MKNPGAITEWPAIRGFPGDGDFHRAELPGCRLDEEDVNGRRHSRLLHRWAF
ncbi:hypothetical protein WEV05_004634 [Salmonella enterica]|nr:hypothetical protein [Salmonella enterica subsp. enterica serovar Muenchen]EFS5969480.1 hypothetical protein [Salmonella enterica]EFT9846417.1 hypothetical protein [Salmonella enterica]EFU0047578.1 hypothetical protein [Salmonella enterica]EFV5168644.1 hypothetical protein [Salmonella enterica]